MDKLACAHIEKVDKNIKPNTLGCEECLKMGDLWVSLRLCLTCGHVGCCDNSKNKHATKHFHATNHPVVKVFAEKNEDWIWCYVDQLYILPNGEMTRELEY